MEPKKLIEFRNIVKNFDGQIVLKGVNLDIYEKEFVTLLGPSGCGKTTLLRILGGFLDADEGQVIFDGEEISKKPPYERELNTVFQKYALFPHLSVYENIAFGLKIKKMSKDIIDQKVMKMLRLIGLEGFENKNTTLLSGGQQQRVAIARALVNEPKVLLLDEPLAALDLKLRKEMQYELKRIQQEVGITFIFVTHDQEEALTMSDKIVVMKGGEIQQIGTPEEIYNEPANRYVANFIGESNIIPGIMLEDYKVRFDDITFDCVDLGFKEKEPVDVVIRPEDIDIVDVKDGKMTGEVLSVLFKGVHYEIMVETVPGTSVTVNMSVIKNQDVTGDGGKEKISASDFYVDIEDIGQLDDKEVIARANAQAWNPESDEYISIAKLEYDVKPELGEYPVRFATANGTEIERKIFVVNQPFVKNEKANEGDMAFSFIKTVDEIKESQALDTDLKTWANAQGWKLSDEEQSVEIYVDYDFDPENMKEGVYRITFSTEGREFKIIPYIAWAVMMLILPMGLIALYSFTKQGNTIVSFTFTLEHYAKFFTDPDFLIVLWRSLLIAFKTTVICLLLGYPVAFFISRSSEKLQNILVLAITIPMWINMLVRTYAWIGLLSEGGLIQRLLGFFGITRGELLYTEGAVLLGMVYNFLPFMVLQINTSLCKMDHSLLEASADLGANARQTFIRVTLPMSLPGVINGITLVFLPAVSSFFIPKLLGGGQYFLIGNLIENQFITVGEWNFGSAISMIMAAVMMLLMMLVRKAEIHNRGGKEE